MFREFPERALQFKRAQLGTKGSTEPTRHETPDERAKRVNSNNSVGKCILGFKVTNVVYKILCRHYGMITVATL